MRRLLVALLFASLAWAADITVCVSGCTYNNMQDAINAANPGDTITLPAGVTFSSAPFTLTNKPGADWITIRSSQWNRLPDGYRYAPDDTRIATISFSSLPDNYAISLTADPAFSSNCWLSQAVGNVVTIGYQHSDELTCEARLANGGLISSTGVVGTVTLLSNAVPAASLRVGLATDGKLRISHVSSIADTTDFTCMNCEVTTVEKNTGTWGNYPENTVPLVRIDYNSSGDVTGIGTAWETAIGEPQGGLQRIWLSGPQAARTDMMGHYAGTYANAYKGPPQGVHHYRFIGIHFRFASTAGLYYGTMFFKNSSRDYRYVPHHFEWDRCVFSQPKASYGFQRWLGIFHGENLLVRNTRFLNSQAPNEGQGILMTGSEGPIVMENIEIDGSTENFLAGGDNATVVGVPQVILRRSLMRKRLEQWPQLQLVRQASTNILALTTTDGVTRCNAGTCTAYYEDTPYTYNQDSTITVTAGQAAAIFVTVSPAGALKVYHNGNVSCAGSFTCVSGTTSRSSFPEDAVLYEWTAAASPGGVWGASSTWSYASYLHKNLFELKMAKNALLEGNIFRTFWAAAQTNMIALTARNQNGPDVFVRLDGVSLARNKLVGGHAGISVLGIDDLQWNTFARGLSFNNNVFLDINKARWGNTTSGGQVFNFNNGNMLGVSVSHNTIDGDQLGFQQEDTTAMNSLLFKNNLWLWNPSSNISGRAMGGGFVNLRRSDWLYPPGEELYGYIGPTSEYRGNLNLGTGAISDSGWTTAWADSAGDNFTDNQKVPSIALAMYLTSITSPAVLADNVRLLTSTTKSVHNAGYNGPVGDGQDPGADVDLVETLTNGVNEGLPPWSDRVGLRIERSGATATVRIATTETTTVQIATHQSMKASTFVGTIGSPTVANMGQTWAVSDLTPGTQYWIKVSTAGGPVPGVSKDRF